MRSHSSSRRLRLAFLAAIPWALLTASLTADDPPVPALGPVVVARVAMPIHPIAAEHVERALAHAVEVDAAAVVIELDTPGGSLPATRRLVQALLGAEVPVVVWVGPGGAQAASAGFFVLLAADVAAMAPGTNTGAAHPVAGSGQDIEGEMGKKVEEDTLALVRSLAEQSGRDLELAQAAVRDSRSFTATEALDAGLVDLLAPDIDALLEALDGRSVGDPDAPPLRTAGAALDVRTMPPGKRLLAALAHPQIAGLLMALGMLGLYVEISNPGLILPGTFGAIALVLGCFALSVLPINVAGLALLALALGFFVAETQVPTFGVLTLGGTVSLVLGLSMLFEDMGPAFAVHPAFPIAVGLAVAALVGFTSWQTAKMSSRRPVTGRDALVGERGTVRGDLVAAADIERAADSTADSTNDEVFRGRVFVHGELWRAESDTPIVAGEPIEVESVDGLLLRVRPVSSSTTPRSLT